MTAAGALDKPNQSRWRLWGDLGAVVAAYILIVFVLCPGTPIIGFPVQHDDFNNLAHKGIGTVLLWYHFRPVSHTVLIMLSDLGVPFYYLALHFLVIVYALLSLRALRRLFDLRDLPAYVALPVAGAMLSYENAVEYSKYAGLVTSLLSGAFAMGAMNLMSARSSGLADKPGTGLGYKTIAGVWFLAALSFWSKEDFVAPVIVLSAFLAWAAFAGGIAGRRLNVSPWLWMVAGLIVEAALLVLYNRWQHSTFTESTSGAYRHDFTPVSILKTAITYTRITPGAKAAFLLAASTLLWPFAGSARIHWSRLLAFHAITASIALAYLCLPNHVKAFYALNWTVWQIGGGLLALWKVWPGPRSAVAIAALVTSLLFVTQNGRAGISAWYLAMSRVNRRVAQTLSDHRAEIEPYRTVAVEGAPIHGPWFASSGRFLRVRLRLDPFWLVRTPKNSEYYRAIMALLGNQQQGNVKTVAIEDEPIPPGVPLLRLRPDGSGTVDPPSR